MHERGKSLRIDVSLATLPDSVQTLQTALQTKAKNEPATRFYSLWDKVYREDILAEAYRRCRANRGAPGGDGETFADIESAGRERWLGRLQQELKAKTYQPQPLLRVWIPKKSTTPRRRGDNYVARRLRIWLMRKRGKRGTGYRQYPDQYLYEELGLIRLLPMLANRSNAKV
jgi:retron-type reverse transcriptase